MVKAVAKCDITDGNFEGKHIATAFATTGTSYTLDLGELMTAQLLIS